jgi:hypothetical protein
MHAALRAFGLALVLVGFGVVAQGGTAGGPSVTLTGPTHAAGQVDFHAVTATPLGQYAAYVELRGIDLTKKPRSSYDHPDFVRTGCLAAPCTFSVGRPASSRYEFVAFLIDSSTRRTLAQSAPVQTTWASNPVNGISFLINGKKWPLQEVYLAEDDYLPIAPGKLKVEARWAAALPKGYSVTIATSEPVVKQYAACKAGIACRPAGAVPIAPQQEMSWQVTVLDKSGAPVEGYQVCLVGKGG